MKIAKMHSFRASFLQKILVYIMILSSIAVLVYLVKLFHDIQGRVLRNTGEGVLLIISYFPFAVNIVFVGVTFFVIVCYGMRYGEDRFIWKEDWHSITIILLLMVMSLSVPFAFMNNKYEISQEGIHKYSTMGNVKQAYQWSDVSEIRIYVKYTPPRTRQLIGSDHFVYELKLEDGRILDLYEYGYTKDIWKSFEDIGTIAKQYNIRIRKDDFGLDALRDYPHYPKYQEMLRSE